MSGIHPTPERIDAYLLGDLVGAELEEIAVHLRDCATCKAAAADLNTTLAAYRDDVPGEVDEVALGRLLAAPHVVRRGMPRWVTATMAATVAALIFTGGFWAGHADATRTAVVPSLVAPNAAPTPARAQTALDPPAMAFVAADADLLGGLAPRDTTWN